MLETLKNIPQELRILKNWVGITLEVVKDKEGNIKYKRDCKTPMIDKNPYQISGPPYKAKSNSPNTWSNFDLISKSRVFKTLGFNFGNSGYVGIDIDGRPEEVQALKNGDFNNEVGAFIKMLNTYTEISQSGNGIHIIGKGTFQGADFKATKSGIEMYKENRYFILTGDILPGYGEIRECTEELQEFYDNNSPKKEETKNTSYIESIPNDLNDADLIEKASTSKNGDKFKKLFYEGASPEEDHSSLDQALCNILAFWTGRDFNRIDSLFRQSALYRDKWERLDYRTMTINKAIENCNDVYNPSTYKPKKNTDKTIPVVIYKNCYNRITYKDGEESFSPISNFFIRPRKLIKVTDSEETRYLCDMINIYGEVIERTIAPYDFSNLQRFNEAINSMDLMFTGSYTDLQYIKTLIANSEMTSVVGVSTLGIHKFNDRWIYIDSKGIIGDTQGIEYIFIGKDEIRSNLSTVEPISSDELASILMDILNCNLIELTSTLLAHCCSFFLKSRLKAHKIKYPNLFISGEAGSGKSQTVEKIVLPLLGYESELKNAGSITPYSIQMYSNSNNTYPIIVDEYKPWFMDKFKRNIISETMRNTYENNSASRGLPGQRNKQEKLTYHAPLIIIGEASTDEKANRERTIFLNFSRDATFKDSTFKVSFNKISRNPESLNKLGRSLIDKVLSLTDEEVNTLYEDSLQLVNDIQMSRNRQNTAVIISGLKLLEMVLIDHRIDYEIMEHVQDIVKYIVEDERESQVTLSEVDESFSTMSSYLLKNPEFRLNGYPGVVINEDKLFLRTGDLHEYTKSSLKMMGTADEKALLPYKDLRKQMSKKPYLDTSGRQVKVSQAGSRSISKNWRVDVFDLEKMESAGIDVEGFQEADEFMRNYYT